MKTPSTTRSTPLTHVRPLIWLPAATLCLLLALGGTWGLLAQVADEPAAPSAQPATQPAGQTQPVGPTQPAANDDDERPVPLVQGGPASPEAATQPATQPTTHPTTRPGLAEAPRRPATQPAAPSAPLCLNFKEASIRVVLDYLSESAGLTVLEEVKVEGRVTVVSRQGVDADEAVALLDSVLAQKGYAAVRIGQTLKILTIEQAKRDLIPVRTGSDPEKIQPTDRMLTQVIPIRYADATKLKGDLASLIPSSMDVASNASSNTLIVTGRQAGVRRVVEIIKAIDVHMSEVSQVKVFQLKYANATNAARLILEIFREDQPAQSAGGMRFGRRAFMIPGMEGGPFGGGGPGGGGSSSDEKGQRPKITASADERTNTLVISAAPDVLKVVEGVIKDLDANPAETQAVFTYRLKNAQAKNVEAVLNSIFGFSTSGTGASTAGRTGVGTTGTFGGTTGGLGGRTGSGGGRSSSGMGGTRSSSGRSSGVGLGSGAMGQSGFGQSGFGQSGFGSGFGSSGTGRRSMGMSSGMAGSEMAGQVFVVADADTNSLLVTTASKYFERVKAIIDDLDRAVPQVLIKVLIAEVTHDKDIDLGAEFSVLNLRASGLGQTAGTNFNVAANTNGFVFKLLEKDVTATIRAIAGASKLDVLSRPYILTSDNQQASIMVGQEVPFITNTRLTETGQTINTIEYDDIGIILYVTPHINPQGLVTMDIYPEISTITGQTVPISETVSAPVFAKRSAQSRLAIRDGQTIVIGGLMEDRNTKTVSKVPLLGDIPLIGAAFRRTIEKKTKTELLIFLTPHVAQQPEDLQGMSEDEQAGTKLIRNAVEPGDFPDHMRGMQRGASTRPYQDPTTRPVIRFGPDKETPPEPDEPSMPHEPQD